MSKILAARLTKREVASAPKEGPPASHRIIVRLPVIHSELDSLLCHPRQPFRPPWHGLDAANLPRFCRVAPLIGSGESRSARRSFACNSSFLRALGFWQLPEAADFNDVASSAPL
jgi:hypothetical protein